MLGSVCYVATWEVLYYRVWPDFGDKYAAHMVDQARASGASATEIAAKQQEAAKFSAMYRNPFYNVSMTFVEPLPVGLLLTLIAAGVMRRRRNGVGVPTTAASSAA